MRNQQQTDRKNTAYLITQVLLVLFFVLLFGRLIQLQVFEHEIYSPISERNSIRQETINPARGLIYDRNGILLVGNEPSFTITVTPVNFDYSTIPLLAELTGLDDETIQERVDAARRFSIHRPSRLMIDVPFQMFSNIQENIWRLPGVDYQVEGKRSYPEEVRLSHSLGYLAEITRQELTDNRQYRMGDQIGRSGIERVFEPHLRGENGTHFVTVNAFGRVVGSYNDGTLDIAPKKGAALHTSIDVELQKLAEKLMEGKTGGLVAMDPRTGEILSIVSAPDYENERLAGRIDRDYWQQLNTDASTPLFHRAIATSQPPGSTLKPHMGLLGLELGLITPQTTVYCSGGYQRGRFYRCLRQHGSQNLEQALETSCNTFFYALIDRMVNRFGLNVWAEMLRSLGLGVNNGIDLTNERPGLIPDSTYFDRVFGVRQWGLGDMISLGIGQGAMGTSPLQLAVSTAVMVNGGYVVQPHVVRAVEYEGMKPEPLGPLKERVSWLKTEHMDVVKRGMRKAVMEGSGRFYANLRDVAVAGKTGTAQNPHGQNHGWFISYAPAENPEIVIAVLLENAGYGSISAAPVAGLLFEQFFYGEVRRNHVKEMMLNFVPAPFEPDL